MHEKDSDKALHALLLSEAEYKLYLTPPSDSARQFAYLHYAGDTSNESRSMRACFFLGEYLEIKEEYSDAVLLYREAATHAENIQDLYYAGLSYRGIGDCYRQLCNSSDALKMMQTARNYFDKAGKEAHKQAITIPIAELLSQLGEYDKAESEFHQALAYYTASGDTNTIHVIYTFYNAMRLERKKMFGSVLDSYRELANEGISFTNYDKGVIAYAYAQKKDVSMATRYISEAIEGAIQINDRFWVDHWAFAVWQELGNPAKAFEASQDMEKCSQSILTSVLSKSVAVGHSSMYYSLYRDKLSQIKDLETKHSMYLYIAMALLTVIICITAALIAIARKEEDVQKENEMLLSKLTLKERELAKASCSSISVGKELLDLICKACHEHNTDHLGKKDREYIMDIINNGKHWKSLEGEVDRATNGAVTRFRSEFPDFTTDDIKLFTLSATGINYVSIAVLMGIDSQNAIANRIYRLKERISAHNSQDQQLFIDLLSRLERGNAE